MSQSIEDTLVELNSWYDEPECQAGDRPKLLSKLALLELCGWIEGTFDNIIIEVDQATINERVWTERNVIKDVSGFEYESHLRRMLIKLGGEVLARRVESQIEQVAPGDLAHLKSLLGTLWKKRCSLAHADMVANVASQVSFDAPSWSL